jgi:hypothetical protein
VQQYDIGEPCDAIVQVAFRAQPEEEEGDEPSPKRQCGAPGTLPSAHTIDIPCHSAILAVQSTFFKTILGPTQVEGEIQVVDILLQDEEEARTMQLLIKLSYGARHYIWDNGRLLPKETRVRLAVLAVKYGFHRCVKEVFESLTEHLTLEEACTCMDELPVELQGEHELMEAAEGRVIAVLTEGITELREREDEGFYDSFEELGRAESERERDQRLQQRAEQALARIRGRRPCRR